MDDLDPALRKRMITDIEKKWGVSEGEAFDEAVANLVANAEAGDIANAVWFLASKYADYITGQILNVDGGFKME